MTGNTKKNQINFFVSGLVIFAVFCFLKSKKVLFLGHVKKVSNKNWWLDSAWSGLLGSAIGARWRVFMTIYFVSNAWNYVFFRPKTSNTRWGVLLAPSLCLTASVNRCMTMHFDSVPLSLATVRLSDYSRTRVPANRGTKLVNYHSLTHVSPWQIYLQRNDHDVISQHIKNIFGSNLF